jgi:hypothetical protein
LAVRIKSVFATCLPLLRRKVSRTVVVMLAEICL